MDWSNVIVRVLNGLLGLLVTAIFLFLLILAIAQQQILAGIGQSSDFSNYSSSLSAARKADAIASQLDGLGEHREQLNAAYTAKERVYNDLWLRYEQAVVALAPGIALIQAQGTCTILDEPLRSLPPEPTEQDIMVARQEARISSFTTCVEMNPDLLPPGARQAFLQRASQATQLSNAASRAWTEMQELQARDGRAVEREARLNAFLERNQSAQSHFRVLDIMRTLNSLGIDFAGLPPFITHVLLAFFSGLFGALLIAMVFLVYPSKLRERVTADLFYKRVFLGGLVGVTVFIMLAGGVSILDSEGGLQTGSNFMSLSAISLLAGMFSDQVADWLSARAKQMFRVERAPDEEEEEDEERVAEGPSAT